MEASLRWEIVEFGPEAWEVMLGEPNGTVPAPQDVSETVDGPHEVGPGVSRSTFERLEGIDHRLAAIEQRLGELGRSEERLDDLERAHGDLERAHAEAQRRSRERDDRLRAELEQIYRQAEARVAETNGKPGWRQRRLEIKLARMERDRKIRRAELRLEQQSQESRDRIEREALAAERRLLDRIAAAEERVRSAEECALIPRRQASPSGEAFGPQ